MQTLVLGTAQWGLDYGVTNRLGRLPDDELTGIVAAARALGVDALDTAPAYGDAELRIGAGVDGFRVQTKLSASPGTGDLLDQLNVSLDRLGSGSVWSVLVHDWPSVPEGDRAGVAARLEGFRDAGLADRVGISGYSAADLSSALGAFGILNVAQLPVSVLDQRLERASEVDELHARGGLLQARSVLLQGVLAGFDSGWDDHPDVLRLRRTGDPVGLALGYIRTRNWVDEVVLGATTADELVEQVTCLRAETQPVDWANLASADEELLDPRTWTARP